MIDSTTHPLHIFSERLAKTGTQDLKLDVGVGPILLEVHDSGQARDAALRNTKREQTKVKLLPFWL